ncbi:MAG: coenzyme F420-0:L-glutamate ligase [Candidatus Thorarchaeota archaeon]|nr:coenzyme F420-0:L-glutamate ligase [Candidatus Thorarchaeota archaeon]
MTSGEVKIIALDKIPIITEKQDIAEIILQALRREQQTLYRKDVILIAHTIISKAEGRVVHSDTVRVSSEAQRIADENEFDPIQVELALRESKTVLRRSKVLVTESTLGFVCNFAGVDQSNAPTDSYVLLPEDPDRSAEAIREKIREATGVEVAVIITDTQGRPWRKGSINVAIGCAGINAFRYNRGKRDTYGHELHRSTVCQIDELAAAAEPVMGQAKEGHPIVIIRGYQFEEGDERAANIAMSQQENLFK